MTGLLDAVLAGPSVKYKPQTNSMTGPPLYCEP
jgi:hypothetical protein